MARSEDAAAKVREALRDAIEWANDLDARLAADDVTDADVEAHAMEANGAVACTRTQADAASRLPIRPLAGGA